MEVGDEFNHYTDYIEAVKGGARNHKFEVPLSMKKCWKYRLQAPSYSEIQKRKGEYVES
jgi:hypothetical protein